MDTDAVYSATEYDLNELGLTERGDMICLKSFAMPNLDPKKSEITSHISNPTKETIANRKKVKRARQDRKVLLEWMYFSQYIGAFQ